MKGQRNQAGGNVLLALKKVTKAQSNSIFNVIEYEIP